MERPDTRDRQPQPNVATIGQGVVVTGEVSCATDLQIDGQVNGDVRCATLLLGEAGVVDGSIQADRLRVSGRVNGRIVAGDLAVEATAKINGEIIYARLKVIAGGVIEGELTHRAAENSETNDLPPLKLVDRPEPKSRRVYQD